MKVWFLLVLSALLAGCGQGSNGPAGGGGGAGGGTNTGAAGSSQRGIESVTPQSGGQTAQEDQALSNRAPAGSRTPQPTNRGTGQ